MEETNAPRVQDNGKSAIGTGPEGPLTGPAGSGPDVHFTPEVAEAHYQPLGRIKGDLAAAPVQEAAREFWRSASERGRAGWPVNCGGSSRWSRFTRLRRDWPTLGGRDHSDSRRARQQSHLRPGMDLAEGPGMDRGIAIRSQDRVNIARIEPGQVPPASRSRRPGGRRPRHATPPTRTRSLLASPTPARREGPRRHRDDRGRVDAPPGRSAADPMLLLRVGRKARWGADRRADDPEHVVHAARDLTLSPDDVGLSVYHVEGDDDARDLAIRYAPHLSRERCPHGLRRFPGRTRYVLGSLRRECARPWSGPATERSPS